MFVTRREIPKRNHVLDGLRGYAALMVAVGHSFITIKNNSKIDGIIYQLVNGGVAVSIFFLLSGYVLGESLRKNDTRLTITKSVRFYIKRIFRIYPIFLLQIILLSIFLLFWSYQRFPGMSHWTSYWFNFPISVKEVLFNLVFRSTSLGGVTWTLKVEMIGSLFIPIFFYFSSRTNKYMDLCIIVFIATLGYMFPISKGVTYLYVFYIGLVLPKWKENFQNIKLTKKSADIIIIGLFGFALFISATTIDVQYPFVRHIPLTLFLGALIYIPTKHVALVLTSRLFQLLGRISYSFYLFHFLVLYVMLRFMFRYIDNGLLQRHFLFFEFMIATSSLFITIFISRFLYRYIEEPCIILGRKAINVVR